MSSISTNVKVSLTALAIVLATGTSAFGQTLVAPIAPPAYKAQEPPNRNLDASLYMQTAAEYRASCFQAYNVAATRLEEALAKQKVENPAVVMDLDETVLDNSGFQAMLLRSGLVWDNRLWQAWEECDVGKVGLIPGVKEFIANARALRVVVIFVSNRDDEFVDQTKTALEGLGIRPGDDLVFKLKKSGADDNKTARFLEADSEYTVLLHIGDNLRDFDDNLRCAKLDKNAPPADIERAIRARMDAVESDSKRFGIEWIILPNPVYGEWMKPLGRGTSDFDRLAPPVSNISLTAQPSPTLTKPAQAEQGRRFQGENSPAQTFTATVSWEHLNLLLLTLFNGFLVVVGFLQWHSIRRQAGYMGAGLTETKRAADAAKLSADAASEAVANSRVTERAIVLIEGVDATMSTPAHGLETASVVIFTLKNFGRAIASAVEFSGSLNGVGQMPIEKSPATTIAPQGNNSWMTRSIGNCVTDDNIRLINERRASLEYKIIVTYGDSFGRYEYHCEGRYEPALKRFLITASKTD